MCILRICHHKEGVDIRRDVLIRSRHLEFPLKIGYLAEAADDCASPARLCIVRR